MNCFAIRKVNWEKLSMLYQYFSECMKINFINNYSIHIRRPMISKKHKDKQAYQRRRDYDQVLVLKDTKTENFVHLKMDAFRRA